jgi:leader peptidase (prepilin peptidase)/N-methyltransferase
VEAVTGGLFLLVLRQRGLGPDLAPALALTAALVAVTAIDLEHQIIPDALTLPGTALGLAWALLAGRPGWAESLLGILLGGGIFFVIIVASRGGMGGGDMKLGAMLGAFLGWKVLLVGLLLAILSGGLVAVVLLALGRAGRKDAVPFGPFLALGGMVAVLWGERLLGWYLGILDR